MKRITVGNNQSIWDIAIREYGSYDGVKQLMIDNPTKCDFENSLPAGTELLITPVPINKAVVDYLSAEGFKPSTAVEQAMVNSFVVTDIYNDDWFFNDNGIWID